MKWIKLETATRMHFKAREAGLEAWGLWVAGLCYCGDYLTDGRIPKKRLNHVWPWMGEGVLLLDQESVLLSLATRLVNVGLWEDHVTHWRVHDYLHYQENRRDMEAGRKANRERQRRHRQKALSRFTEPKDPSPLLLTTPLVTRDVTRTVTRDVTRESHTQGLYSKSVSSVTPSVPDPEGSGGGVPEVREEPPIGLNPSEAVWTVWLKFQACRATLGREPERFDAAVESLVERALAWAGGVEREIELLDRFLWIAQHPDAQKGTFKYSENFRPHIVFDTMKHQGTARDFPVKANGTNGKAKHREKVGEVWYPCGAPSCPETGDHEHRP